MIIYTQWISVKLKHVKLRKCMWISLIKTRYTSSYVGITCEKYFKYKRSCLSLSKYVPYGRYATASKSNIAEFSAVRTPFSSHTLKWDPRQTSRGRGCSQLTAKEFSGEGIPRSDQSVLLGPGDQFLNFSI